MLISIVIPNFNYGKYIATTVKSLLLQNNRQMEVIIIDDGSTDDSQNIITTLKREFEDCFISFKLILEKHNAGKLAALNKAFNQIEGDYTIILDSDDYLDASYINETLAELERQRHTNKNVGFIYTDCILIDESGMVLTNGKSSVFSKERIQSHSYIPECAITLTETLKSSMPFDESIRVGTKHHKWKRIIEAGWEGVYLNKPLFYYRMHACNISGIGNRVLNDIYNSDNSKEKILSGLWPLETKYT